MFSARDNDRREQELLRHQQYIGKLKNTVFDTQKRGRKRVVVSTEENVIESVDLRHGEIFCRCVHGGNNVVDEIDAALGNYVITLSSEGSILRAWNLSDSQMVWQTFINCSGFSKWLLIVPNKGTAYLGKDIFGEFMQL